MGKVTWSDIVRLAVAKDTRNQKEIAAETQGLVSAHALSRFARGRAISSRKVDVLAEVVGLSVG